MIRIPRSASLKASISSSLEEVLDLKEAVMEREGPAPRAQPSNRSADDWCKTSPSLSESPAIPTSCQEQADKSIHLGCIEYEPFKLLFAAKDKFIGATLDVRIPVRFFDDDHNVALRKRYIYGGSEGIYTDDSDAAAILRQRGFVLSAGSAVIKATFKVLPRLERYDGVEMNGIRSRSWRKHSGLSLAFVEAKCVSWRAPRHKQHSRKIPQSDCLIRFSSTLHRPTMSLATLPLDSCEERLLRTPLILEGCESQYALFRDEGGKYTIQKHAGAGTLELFRGLDWREMEWNVEDLIVRKTRLRIRGCYWQDQQR